jgi:hypothetical protein
VCLYVSWSDETSVDSGKGPFVIAGIVADNDCWPGFSKRWVEEVLEPSPAIPYDLNLMEELEEGLLRLIKEKRDDEEL